MTIIWGCLTNHTDIPLALLALLLCGCASFVFLMIRIRPITRDAARLRLYVAELETARQSREAANETLRQALSATAAANQAKSVFLANMSHELRTPLNAIIGFSDMMRQAMFGPLGDPHYVEYSEDIHASGQHLLNLITDVLDFSKIDSGRFELHEEVIDVRETVENAVHMITAQAEKKLSGSPSMRWKVDRGCGPIAVGSRKSCSICCRTASNSRRRAARSKSRSAVSRHGS